MPIAARTPAALLWEPSCPSHRLWGRARTAPALPAMPQSFPSEDKARLTADPRPKRAWNTEFSGSAASEPGACG